MEHPIKRESIHDSELTEQFEKKSCPARSSPTIPGSSSSIGAELRRSRTDGTLRDDNRQIYETAYRSSTKSNFRVRRSRIIVSPAFPRHEVCVCMCVCVWNFQREGCRIVGKNFLKYFEIDPTYVEHIVFWKGDPVSIVSLCIPRKLDWLEANIDFCFGWRSNWWICTVFPWASLWSWNRAGLVSDLF